MTTSTKNTAKKKLTKKKLNGEFQVTGWDEKPYLERDGKRLTRASVTQKFSGAIQGEGSVEWLMCYRPDGTADFVGLQHIDAIVDGRDGAVVVRSFGEFDGRKAVGEWSVIDGSATGELNGATGSGHFDAPMGGTPTFELELVVQ
jgi:hypothetical protein